MIIQKSRWLNCRKRDTLEYSSLHQFKCKMVPYSISLDPPTETSKNVDPALRPNFTTYPHPYPTPPTTPIFLLGEDTMCINLILIDVLTVWLLVSFTFKVLDTNQKSRRFQGRYRKPLWESIYFIWELSKYLFQAKYGTKIFQKYFC